MSKNKLVSKSRYARGELLANSSRIRKIPRTTKAQLWKVQSQSHPEIEYNVVFNHDELTCDCKDFTERGELCKHCYAVIIREVSFKPEKIDISGGDFD